MEKRQPQRRETSVFLEVEEVKGEDNFGKVYKVKTRLETGEEWTVFRNEEDFIKVGLKVVDRIKTSFSSKLIKTKAAQSVQEELMNNNASDLLVFLDPTIQPPAYAFTNADKRATINVTYGPLKFWTLRYVVVALGHLYIYKSEASGSPLAMIDLVCSVVDANKDSKTYFFVLYDNTKYIFESESEEEMREWVNTIRRSRDSVIKVKDTTLARYVELQKEVNRNQSFDEAMEKFHKKKEIIAEKSKIDDTQLKNFATMPRRNWKPVNRSTNIRSPSKFIEKGSIGSEACRAKKTHTFRNLRTTMVSLPACAVITPEKKSQENADFQAIREQITQKREKSLFRYPDTEEYIIYDEDKYIKGATFNKLLEILCNPKRGMDQFTLTFLLTYPGFTTSAEFLEELSYHWDNPEGTTEEEHKFFRERIGSIISKWVELQFNQFLQAKQLTDRLIEFVNSNVRNKTMTNALATWIRNVIRTKLEQHGNTATEIVIEPVLPQLYKNCQLGWLDIDPLEIARQLTIVQMKLFSVLSFDEFVGQKWTKPEKGEAPNILNSIERFNKISGWAAEFILHLKSPVQRGLVLSKLIDIAYECIILRNFDTVVQIISGIENSAVSRLKRSWGYVTEKHINKLEELREIFNPQENWKRYRSELSNSEPPVIPYLGLYLQSLTFGEDGNPDFLPPNNLINWQKYDLIASILMEIHKNQLAGYALPVIPEVRDLFTFNDYAPPTDKQLYEWSLELEPRVNGEDLGKEKQEIKRQKEELQNIKEKFKQHKQIEKQKEKEEKEREKKEKEKEREKAEGDKDKKGKQKSKVCNNCGKLAGVSEALFCQFCGTPVSDLTRSTYVPVHAETIMEFSESDEVCSVDFLDSLSKASSYKDRSRSVTIDKTTLASAWDKVEEKLEKWKRKSGVKERNELKKGESKQIVLNSSTTQSSNSSTGNGKNPTSASASASKEEESEQEHIKRAKSDQTPQSATKWTSGTTGIGSSGRYYTSVQNSERSMRSPRGNFLNKSESVVPLSPKGNSKTPK